MKLKSGPDLVVLGEVNVDNRPHVICKAIHPFYTNGVLVSMLVLPVSEFEHNNGAEWCEVIPDAVDLSEVPKDDRSEVGAV
jgi:hypothetical protein